MSRQKDMYMDHEEMFHDEVADRVPSFDTFQSAFDWVKSHAETTVPWMAKDLSGLEKLVSMYWEDYQSDHAESDLSTIWDAYGESIAYDE
jgi:hypothetical protein